MKILIMGATSAIAQETARIWAREGHELFLAAVEKDKLKAVADDLWVLGAKKVETFMLDALDYGRHAEMIASAVHLLGGLDAALIAHGYMGLQEKARRDMNELHLTLELNFTSVASLLTLLADHFVKQGHGTLAAITSPAGDRGRQSNYVYGAAKGALTVFLSGLRNQLSGTKVKVVTLKPGMVDTPMTAHMKKGILFSTPGTIAKGIVRAMRKGRDVVYLPSFWRYIMLIILHIPEGIFKKLKL